MHSIFIHAVSISPLLFWSSSINRARSYFTLSYVTAVQETIYNTRMQGPQRSSKRRANALRAAPIMNSALLYTVILLADALAWVVVARYGFFLTTIGKLTIDRRLLQPKDRLDWARRSDRLRSALYYLPTCLDRWYEADDRDLTGFTPARVQRSAVAGLVAVQNILLVAFPLVGAGGWDATGRRCGQLACVNAVCCGLLAHPAYTISRIVRQNDRELAWMHSLFAWHGWYEAWAHMLLSLGLMTRWTGKTTDERDPCHPRC